MHAPASRPMIGVNRGANFGARRLVVTPRVGTRFVAPRSRAYTVSPRLGSAPGSMPDQASRESQAHTIPATEHRSPRLSVFPSRLVVCVSLVGRHGAILRRLLYLLGERCAARWGYGTRRYYRCARSHGC